MDIRTALVLTGVALVAGLAASPARALPNCDTCVPAYENCVASGATDCDTQYRACLRYCPVLRSDSTAKDRAYAADKPRLAQTHVRIVQTHGYVAERLAAR